MSGALEERRPLWERMNGAPLADNVQSWAPPVPYELVEATEHHGPYICTSYGTTVCDFYAMSDPTTLSVRNGGTSRPIPFTDAAEHAAFMVRAANAHGEMLEALKRLDAWWLVSFPGGPDGDRSWGGGIGMLSDDTVEIWRSIRAAILAGGAS
jgi:hypothetical protein